MTITYPPEMLPSPDEGQEAEVIVMDPNGGWQPISTAPKEEPIIVWGYRIQGELSPDGSYKYFWRTVGQLPEYGECLDLLEPGCDCIRQRTMTHPLMWMPLPNPPDART